MSRPKVAVEVGRCTNGRSIARSGGVGSKGQINIARAWGHTGRTFVVSLDVALCPHKGSHQRPERQSRANWATLAVDQP